MAIAAQQSRSERDQEVKPNKAEPQSDAHLPPSITPEGRSRLLSRGESSAHGAAGDRVPGTRPPCSACPPCHPRHQPPATLAPFPLCPPHPSQRTGAATGEPRCFASLPVGSEKKEELFQCLMESSLLVVFVWWVNILLWLTNGSF